ncbi:Pentatricopeptide repeat, partial [Dillenia turbinata]
MRGLSSLASRVSPAIINRSRDQPKLTKFREPNHSNSKKSKPSSLLRRHVEATLQDAHISAAKPVDHQSLGRILSRKDWFLLLKHEFNDLQSKLSVQLVVSILQNQENPLNCLRFYIWVSNLNAKFGSNLSIRAVLANTLYRKGPVLLSVEFIREIRSCGYRISEELLCVLFGSWGRLGLAKYCAEIFGQISFLGLSPSTRLYNAVIDALVKSNSLDLAYLKFHNMAVDNCKPDRFTYNILIHGVCRIGVVDEALRLIKQMESIGHRPNVFTYTILIDGYCTAKRVDEAFGVLNMMKERSVNPSDATFRSLVYGVFRAVEPEKALELLTRYLEVEPILPKLACDAIFYCLSSKSMPRETASFLKRAIEKGYLPDNATFNVTMASLIKGADLDEMCELLDTLLERGLKLALNTSLSLVEAFYAAGKGEEGTRYLELMVKDGLVSNVFSYNMLIDSFVKVRMMDKAYELLQEMRTRGIVPNLVTFNTVIKGHCKAIEIGKAREFLEMLLELGLKPDIFTFNSIIDGLCRAHRVDEAFDCFNEMVEWGVAPDAFTYNILIHYFCISGHVTKSLDLFRKMQSEGISPDVFSFNSVIQSFCRMKKIEKAQNFLITMLMMDLTPDNFTYCAFIKALCELGRFDEAKEIFLSMEANGCRPDSYTCNTIMGALIRSAHFEEAQYIARKCKDYGILLEPIHDGGRSGLKSNVIREENKWVISRQAKALLMLETLLLHILGEKADTPLSQTLPMAFSLIFRQRLLAAAMFSVLVFSCQLGNGLEEPYQTGTAVNDPTEIVGKALLCFDNKNIYADCEEAYRLTESGNVNVTRNETDAYCEGPCLTETHFLLTCIENILTNFEFYNKATIQD